MESESSFADAFLGRIFDIFGLLLGRKVRSGRILFVGDNGRDDDILITEDRSQSSFSRRPHSVF